MARSLYVILVPFLLALPVAAQNKAPIDENQCADRFKAADINNDGTLSASEIGTFKQKLPASLADRDRVGRAEFMAVCGKKAS